MYSLKYIPQKILGKKFSEESDCIIAVGSRFDDRTTGNTDYYAPVAKKKNRLFM